MTSVEICNLALARIGAGRISTLDETNSSEAYQCKLHYDAARRQVISAGPWGFAETLTEASQLGISPPAGWSYAYAEPVDALEVYALYPEGVEVGGEGVEFMEQGGTLYTKVPVASILYKKDEDNPGRFSEGFSRTLIAYLAYLINIALTGRYSQKQILYREYAISLREALGIEQGMRVTKGAEGFDNIANVWGGTRA